MIEVAILGSDQQLTLSVAVPVDRRRAGSVPSQLPIAQGSLIAEYLLAFGGRLLTHPVNVHRIDEQIAATVAVPVNHTQLAASALAGGAVV